MIKTHLKHTNKNNKPPPWQIKTNDDRFKARCADGLIKGAQRTPSWDVAHTNDGTDS